ncbi:unnamed protein product [Caenorhabditis bovis]|uniref:Uncharacterized protein n=1 Tax=Caenorhabditis bovis TaxID=2654633 RepID=A0A8S1EMN6_9PELO|nr:unnamed protein product [Caenorhabditis bovis]
MRLFLLLLLLFPVLIFCADPLEQLIRNGWLIVQDYGEKMLSNIVIPRSSDLPEGSAFQLDDGKTLGTLKELMNTCPQTFMVREVQGTWYISHISKRLLHNTFFDVHRTIERLSQGKMINSRTSLFTLISSDPSMNCLQLTILNDSPNSPFEFSYKSENNERKSIIGSVSRSSDNQLTLNFADIFIIPFSRECANGPTVGVP